MKNKSFKTITFNLKDIDIYIKKKYTIGIVIASTINFQNLSEIGKSYSLLLYNEHNDNEEHRIFKEFEKFIKSQKNKSIFFLLDKNYYRKLDELLKLRHDIVHYINFNRTLDIDYIQSLVDNLINFFMAFDSFIYNKFINKPE